MVRIAFRAAGVFLGTVLLAGAAYAGNFSYADGRGNWQSTQCTKPGTMTGIGGPSEIPANDLNAQVNQHNAMVAAHDAYLKCLSDEASRDAAAVAQLIVTLANQQIEQTQQEMQVRAQQMQQEVD